MIPPQLTDDQRRAASELAVHNRRRRAEVKQQLRNGLLRWEDLLHLSRQDDVIAGLRVHEVLISLPGLGPVRVRNLMERIGISQGRRLRGLGPRQQAELAVALDSE